MQYTARQIGVQLTYSDRSFSKSLSFRQDMKEGGKQVSGHDRRKCYQALLLTACVKLIFQVYFKNMLCV